MLGNSPKGSSQEPKGVRRTHRSVPSCSRCTRVGFFHPDFRDSSGQIFLAASPDWANGVEWKIGSGWRGFKADESPGRTPSGPPVIFSLKREKFHPLPPGPGVSRTRRPWIFSGVAGRGEEFQVRSRRALEESSERLQDCRQHGWRSRVEVAILGSEVYGRTYWVL